VSHKFFSNKACEYFPCHKDVPIEKFNCIFCYCPLYPNKGCPGVKTYLDNGLKDCSACKLPHFGERGWQKIIEALPRSG